MVRASKNLMVNHWLPFDLDRKQDGAKLEGYNFNNFVVSNLRAAKISIFTEKERIKARAECSMHHMQYFHMTLTSSENKNNTFILYD